MTLPNRYWGPALVKHRRLITYVEDFVIDPEGEKRQLDVVNKSLSMSRSQIYVNTGFEDEVTEYEDEDYEGSVGTRVSYQ